MADKRRVTVQFTEMHDKTGTMDVDFNEVRTWLGQNSSHQPTAKEVEDFITSGDFDPDRDLDNIDFLSKDLDAVHGVDL